MKSLSKSSQKEVREREEDHKVIRVPSKTKNLKCMEVE